METRRLISEVYDTNIIDRIRSLRVPRRLPRLRLPNDFMSTNDEENIETIASLPRPIRVLYLDGRKTQIMSIGTLRRLNLTKLEELTMVNMRIVELHPIPRMPKLEILDLSDNRITGNLQRLQVCQRLHYLNLSRNKIKTIETLIPLKELKCLKSLELFGNDVIFVVNYRQKVFDLIKTLKYLDGSVQEAEEVEE